MISTKKSWLELKPEPASRHQCPHINLVMVVVMIPMVAVVAVPIVVCGASGIAVVPIGSVVSIRVIAISIWIVIVAVPVSRITKSDSN